MLLVSPLVSRALTEVGVKLMVAELLEAVRASLRAKVVALAEDNWMYEAEEEPAVR